MIERPDDAVALGHDHWASFQCSVLCDGDCSIVSEHTHDVIITPDRTRGTVLGLMVWHPHSATGEPCAGGIGFANTTADDGRTLASGGHTLVSLDPLTVGPLDALHSLLCCCGDHGHVVDEHWRPLGAGPVKC